MENLGDSAFWSCGYRSLVFIVCELLHQLESSIVLWLQCYRSYIQLLLICVVSNYTCSVPSQYFHNCRMHSNHLQMALVHITLFYLVFMHATKISQVLNNCYVSISHFYLAGHFVYCTFPVLIWALSGWPIGRVHFLYLPPFLFTWTWFARFYRGIEYWTSSRGYFTVAQCSRHHRRLYIW